VVAVIPETISLQVFEGQYINIELPATQAKTQLYKVGSRFVPLEAVYVTNLERYVFVAVDNKATRKLIKTGEIIGNEIEVLEGLNSGDQLILDRRVTDGQSIEPIIQENKVEERG
jgi:hypothetical protein